MKEEIDSEAWSTEDPMDEAEHEAHPYNVLDSCAYPVLYQGVVVLRTYFASSVIVIFVCSYLLKKLANYAKTPRANKFITLVENILFCCLAVFLVHNQFSRRATLIVLATLLFFITLFHVFSCLFPGKFHVLFYITVLSCVAIGLLNEFFVDSTVWHTIRGCQMIITMKVISLSHTLSLPASDDEIRGGSTFSSLIVYLCHPANTIYGPWISHRDTHNSCETEEDGLDGDELDTEKDHTRNECLSLTRLIVSACKCLLLYSFALFWLVISSCLKGLVVSIAGEFDMDIADNRWTQAYFNTQSFRSSHYFICFLSQANCELFSVWKSPANVVSPMSMELPRSIVQVVTHWNRPMHIWLKNYVFQATRKFGRFVAILITFLASSMLHNFNFQLTGILVSLGLYSYAEFQIRLIMANQIGACVAAHECVSSTIHTKKDCGHKFKKHSFVSLAINSCWTFLALFFLTYIAAGFDASDQQYHGYSMRHTITAWAKLSYAGHFLVIALYIVMFFMKFTLR